MTYIIDKPASCDLRGCLRQCLLVSTRLLHAACLLQLQLCSMQAQGIGVYMPLHALAVCIYVVQR